MQEDKIKMKKIKVATLTGPLLDYWVAKANEMAHVFIEGGACWQMQHGDTKCPYSPSTDWSQGGPIIERERISIHWDSYLGIWKSYADTSDPIKRIASGKTPLIAAMRLYVLSKFGEEVDEI